MKGIARVAVCSLVAIAPLGGGNLFAAELQVVPAVQSWQEVEGAFETKGASLLVESATPELKRIAVTFQNDLALIGKAPAKLTVAEPGKASGIVLTLDRAGRDLKPGGYAIEIADKVTLRGADAAGVFNGTRTLLQLLAKDSKLPKGTIVDWPGSPRRMLMLDVARKAYPMPVLKDYLRMMAWYKMNELHLHFSDEAFGGGYSAFRIESKKFPGLAAKDLYYTAKDLRELQDFAHELGITITPEIDMPGHARCFTTYWPEIALKDHPNYMDVTNPKTIERMKELLDEIIPLFDAPDFHIGTDEYRVGGSAERKLELHEGFRKFINTMNTHVRSKGKNTRIWSGFEHMQGTTEPDPSITIDMWETDDAKSQIAKGHKVINSNHGRTYIVPGARYYGVSNAGIYQGWEPWMISGDASKNPAKDDPAVLGGKLHVWNDQGPTGYTMTEIAELTFPSMQAFSEKMWGTKGSPSYEAFQTRAARTVPVPGVHVFDRIPAKDKDGVVLSIPREMTLDSVNARIPLIKDDKARADLEYPWTLTMEILKTGDTDKRGVILSSAQAEVCADYSREEEQKSKDANGKEVKTKVTRKGIGLVRAGGSPGVDPASSHIANDLSRVYGESPAKGKWMKLTVVGDRRRTTLYVDGMKVGDSDVQTICPLGMLGSPTGNSFVGKVRNLKVYDRALSAKEIGRSAGLDLPDNLAAGGKVTASAADNANGFKADLAVDGNPGSRWSSGPTKSNQWLAVDLGKEQEFNTLTLAWEEARAGKIEVEVSADGKEWKRVAEAKVDASQTAVSFPMVRAKHVRLVCSDATTGWGYSIYELEVLKKKTR